MAGNKVSSKTKGREDKAKTTKGTVQNNEENEDFDFTLLRKPIFTSITGFAQARKIFDLGTEELQGLIANECDLLYECKVCRNIFRSLANFISHKRVYCTEQFNASLHGQLFKMSSAANEMMKIKKLEEKYFETLKEKEQIETVEISEADGRIPLTKDLTAIIEKIVKSKGVQKEISEETQLVLQKIPNTSVAVFQNFDSAEEKLDKMRAQVKELDNILSQDKAVLQSDGKFKIQSSISSDTDSVIQISDDEENDGNKILKCNICSHNFSTTKTLKFHMKYKHLESRLVYPCPDCLEIFSTSWSVYRHLFKVHRKTAAQIRRMRESIQSKAFRMNNPPAFYERRKNMKPPTVQKISDEERLDQENQAWMDNVEGDGDIPRCFGCGRTFERRAALAAHTHTCQPRARALARRPPETKKIEIQIRKDYNKGPTSLNLLKTTDSNENKILNEEMPIAKSAKEPDPRVTETMETDIKETECKETETKETESKETVTKETVTKGTVTKETVTKETMTKKTDSKETGTKETENEIEDEQPQETAMDVSETETTPDSSPEKSNENVPPPVVPNKPVIKLPFAQQIEKSNLTALRQKIQPDIDVNKLMCKKCEIQHDTVQEMYEHMAGHYKWMRYACKLCNFKHYELEKLPEHVKVVHKLKGDNEFYFSTVKAIDGNEALEFSESMDDSTDANDASPDFRRQSRCSSDSSRLSDDSSSSSTRMEVGSRKRKMFHSKNYAKRKKESLTNDDEDQRAGDLEKDLNNIVENGTSMLSKTFEENSSDMDDIEDKMSKRHFSSVASRRPVRKKTKTKNEDFEYDLSNLLKMEAQGYRDAQSVSTKTAHTKKKPISLNSSNFYEIITRDCNGALATLSKKAAVDSAAHMKITSFVVSNASKDPKPSNIFARPMLPKTVSRGDKSSPKKDIIEESKDNESPKKEVKVSKTISEDITKTPETEPKTNTPETTDDTEKEQTVATNNTTVKTNSTIPSAVLPIKIKHQSMELMNNPLINKNITDFKKAGMKTKILVIKPIHRNKDGTASTNTPLKFQTIKLKDPSKSSSSKEDKSSEQVLVVKVPKVDCAISRQLPDKNTVGNEKITQAVHDTSTNNVKNPAKPPNPKTISDNVRNDDTAAVVKDIPAETEVVKGDGRIDKDKKIRDSNKSEDTNVINKVMEEELVNKTIETAT